MNAHQHSLILCCNDEVMKFYISENQEEKNKKNDVLNYHLKHLEFLLFFEIQLEQGYANDCSSNFLEKFKVLKHEAQVNVLIHSSDQQKKENT